MADNGRARLAEVEHQFSRLASGAAGRQERTIISGSRAPEPRINAFADDHGGASAQPRNSHYGLAEFYGAREEPWGGASVGLTATQPENRRYTELLDGPPAALRPEGPHVGTWSSIFDRDGLHSADPAPDLGRDDEVDWVPAVMVGAAAAVAFCWGVVQRHKVASALWAAVIVAWIMPLVIR